MTSHTFGGDWTSEKLERIRKYLSAYTTIFRRNVKAQYFTTTYVDAFAGTGYRTQSRVSQPADVLLPELASAENQEFLKGSARIALEVDPPFDYYLFVERSSERAGELDKLRSEFPAKARRIRIEVGDANQVIQQWCRRVDWRSNRAVVFLDPYGMQVEWQTIQAIANTKGIDLWILFPLGMAVNRLLTKHEPPPPPWAQALTRLFGTEEWRSRFYPPQKTMTLWGEKVTQSRQADFDAIAQFFVERLESVFAKVAPNPLALLNSRNVPLYLLCFAVGNPAKASIAVRIADNILRGPYGH